MYMEVLLVWNVYGGVVSLVCMEVFNGVGRIFERGVTLANQY